MFYRLEELVPNLEDMDPSDLKWFLELVEGGQQELFWKLQQYEYETYTGRPRKRPFSRPKNWEKVEVEYVPYKLTTNDSKTQNTDGCWLDSWADGLEILWYRHVGDPTIGESYDGPYPERAPDRWLPIMYFNDRPAWDKFQADLNAKTEAAQKAYDAKRQKTTAEYERAEYERLKKKFGKK
jgi:hypothetical protein